MALITRWQKGFKTDPFRHAEFKINPGWASQPLSLVKGWWFFGNAVEF